MNIPRRTITSARRALCVGWVALLALGWIPASSHVWLELAGLIHHDGHDEDHGVPGEDNGPAHEAADGICRIDCGGFQVKAPIATASIGAPIHEICLLLATPREKAAAKWIARSTAPPGLVVRWHFDRRAALPPLSPTSVA